MSEPQKRMKQLQELVQVDVDAIAGLDAGDLESFVGFFGGADILAISDKK